jgi:hypothetical protein
MWSNARRFAAGVVVGMLLVTLVRGLPAMAQGPGNVQDLALHFYPSTLDPAKGDRGWPRGPLSSGGQPASSRGGIGTVD